MDSEEPDAFVDKDENRQPHFTKIALTQNDHDDHLVTRDASFAQTTPLPLMPSLMGFTTMVDSAGVDEFVDESGLFDNDNLNDLFEKDNLNAATLLPRLRFQDEKNEASAEFSGFVEDKQLRPLSPRVTEDDARLLKSLRPPPRVAVLALPEEPNQTLLESPQQSLDSTLLASPRLRFQDEKNEASAEFSGFVEDKQLRPLSPRVTEDDARLLKSLRPPPRVAVLALPEEPNQTLLESPQQSLDSTLLASSDSIASALLEQDDEYTQDEDEDEDEDFYEEAPQMVALGLPVVPQESPSIRARGRSEEFKEEVQEIEEFKEEVQDIAPRRHNQTMDEINQIAIDEALGSNIAVNARNAKGGKKSLPENIDESAIVRRHSSRMSVNKSGGFPFGDKGSGELGNEQGSNRRSIGPPRATASSPVFGSRPTGDWILDDVEEDSDDLMAHAGLPLAMPGAYFIAGLNPTDRHVSDMTDLSVFEDEAFQDEEQGPADQEQGSAVAPTPEPADGGIEAELAPQAPILSGVVVDGELVSEDDGMTEDERKAASCRWRKIQVCVAVGIVILAAIIVAVVATTRSNDSPKSEANKDEAWVLVGSSLSGPPDDDNLFFGISVSLSGDGKRFATGLPGIDKSVTVNDVGQVQIFDFEGEGWVLTSTLDFDTRQGKAGEAVALSTDGGRVIVGSPFWSNEVGLISVFEYDGSDGWQQIGSDTGGKDSDREGRFGKTVSISQDGRIIAAGAPFAFSESVDVGGVVRVFEDIGSEWVQMGQDLVPKFNNTLFGTSIAMSADGRRIAVGATNVDIEVGRLVVFDFNGTDWSQTGQALDGANDFDNFGGSVALSAGGNLLAVGAIGSPGADSRFNSGKVQVFEFDGMSWVQLGGDILGRRSESLGTSVDLSDDGILAVGSPSEGEAGQVKVYSFDETNGWTQVENEIDGDTDDETFGFSVSISSDGTIVGSGAPNANFDGGRMKKVGSVRVYQNTKP